MLAMMKTPTAKRLLLPIIVTLLVGAALGVGIGMGVGGWAGGQSQSIEIGDTESAEIVSGGEIDEWTFEGTAGQNIVITLQASGTSSLDTMLDLRAPSGTIEDSNDDSGGTYNSRIDRPLAETGIYTIVAKGFGGYSIGLYELTLSAGVEHALDEGGPIDFQETKSAELHPNSDTDEWTFGGTAGQHITIALQAAGSSGLDTMLDLRAPSGTIEDSNDDSGGTYNSFIDRSLAETGTYTIVAKGYSGAAGAYELTLSLGTARVPDQYEAGRIDFQETKNGDLYPRDDTDEWTFEGTAGQDIVITLQAAGGSDLDTMLDLRAPSGTIEDSNDDSGGTYNSRIDRSLAETGTYTIVARGYSGAAGAYDLTLDAGVGHVADEGGPIAISESMTSELHPRDDTDEWTFEGTAGQEVVITLQAAGNSGLDTILDLRAPSGTIEDSNDDSGGTYNSLINRILAETGTYTIVARGYSGASGAYALSISSGATTSLDPTAPPVSEINTPGSPTELVISEVDQADEILLQWGPPADDGGAPITGYSVTSSSGQSWFAEPTLSAANTVSRSVPTEFLQPGQTYMYAVVAVNSAGIGSASESSITIAPTIPSAPENLLLGTGAVNGEIVLTWDASAYNGGSPITGYSVWAFEPGLARDNPAARKWEIAVTDSGASGGQFVHAIKDFEQGKDSAFAVAAQNVAGEGPLSQILLDVPTDLGDITVDLNTTDWDGVVTLGWDRPANDPENPALLEGIDIYYSSDATCQTLDCFSLKQAPQREQWSRVNVARYSQEFYSLGNGPGHRFIVVAYNAIGRFESPITAPITIIEKPYLPCCLKAVPGNKSAVVSWESSVSRGGGPITYRVTATPGGQQVELAGDPNRKHNSVTVPGLTNGTQYTFDVSAFDLTGGSPAPQMVFGTPVSMFVAVDGGQLEPITQGTLGSDEEDLWSFEATLGTKITLAMAVTEGDIKPLIVISAPSGMLTAWDTSITEGPGTTISINDHWLTETGTYSVRAASLTPAAGRYTLTLNSSDPTVKVVPLGPEWTGRAWTIAGTGNACTIEPGTRGEGVEIAILDSGIDYNHPDLLSQENHPERDKVVRRINFVGYDFAHSPSPYALDPAIKGHGTEVAGMAAGSGSINSDMAGVAPGACLWAVKTVWNLAGAGFEEWGMAGFDYAVRGPDGTPGTGDEPDVIAHATGSPGMSDGFSAMGAMLDIASEQGIVVVQSAGNQPASMYTLNESASSRNAITVGALTQDLQAVQGRSSRGPTADMRIKPDLVAPGQNVYTTKAHTEHNLEDPGYQPYTITSGTSIAVPYVAGVAALIKQRHPDWTPAMVKAAMMNTADPLPSDRLWEQGAGAVNKDRAVATNLLVMPPSLSFGQLTLGKSGSHTITLHNVGEQTLDVNISTATSVYSGKNWPQNDNTGNGLYLDSSSTVSVSSSTATVNAGSSTTVDLSAGPFTSESLEGWYEGRVSLTSSEGTLTLPYIFYLSHTNAHYDDIFPGPRIICGNSGIMARIIGTTDCNTASYKPRQYPTKPDSNDQIYITTMIGDARDSVPSGIPGAIPISIELIYSVSSDSNYSTVVTMVDDGKHGDRYANDRVYGASIGPFDSGEAVTYYVRATNEEDKVLESQTVTFTVQEPFIKTSDILVIDDDRSNQGLVLTNVIDSLGLPYDFWDEATRGAVTLSTLNSYLGGVVIAAGVSAQTGPNMRDYLDAGGNLFLATGQPWTPNQFGDDGINFAVKYLNAEQWSLEEYFSSALNGTGIVPGRKFGGVEPSLQGVKDDPIGDGLELGFGIRSPNPRQGFTQYCGDSYADPVQELRHYSILGCDPNMLVLRSVEYDGRNDVEEIFHFGPIAPPSAMIHNEGTQPLVDRIVKMKDGVGVTDFQWEADNPQSFHDPVAIVVDETGNIYVADGTDRIYKYGPDRQLINTLGGSRHLGKNTAQAAYTGTDLDLGKFYRISGMALDSQGNLYVADVSDTNGTVSILDSDGYYLGKVGGEFQWGASKYEGYDRALMDTQITTPVDVVIDRDDNVWVVDLGATFWYAGHGKNRVLKFESGPGGSHISTPVSRREIPADGIPCQTRDTWTGGSDRTRIAIHNDGATGDPQAVLLAGTYPYEGGEYGSLQLITSSGVVKGCNDPNFEGSQWGNAALGQVENPRAIAVDGSGHLIVGHDTGNYHLVNGRHVNDDTSEVIVYDINTGQEIRRLFKDGVENNLFALIADIFVASDDSIYILEGGNSNPTVQKFSASGEFLWTLGNNISEEPIFNGIRGITHDNAGNIYAVDSFNQRIVKLDSEGNVVATFGTKGHGAGEFYFPEGVAISDDGSIFVADTGNHRIQKLDRFGQWHEWGSKGSSESEFKFPKGIALDGNGNVYVSDTENHRIQKFTSEGDFISMWGGPRPFSEQRGRSYSRGPDYTGENTRYMGHDGQINNPRTNEEVRTSRTTGEKIFTNVNGYLWYPGALTIDSAGNVYVADTRHGMVQKFSPEGELLDPAAEYRMGYGAKSTQSDLADGVAVAVGNDGNIYTSGMRLHPNVIGIVPLADKDTSYVSMFVPGDLAGEYDDRPVWSELESQYATGVDGLITGLTVTDSGDIYAAVSSFVDYPVGRPAAYRLDNGLYKVVYFGFDVNAIVEPWQRDEVLSRALSWLSGIEAGPTVISPTAIADVSDQAVTFKWAPAQNATDYRLQILNIDDPESSGVQDFYLTETEVQVVMTPGNYYWRVLHRDDDCLEGRWSKSRNIIVSGNVAGNNSAAAMGSDFRCAGVNTTQSTPAVTTPVATSTPAVTTPAATSQSTIFQQAYSFAATLSPGQTSVAWDPQIGVRIAISEAVRSRHGQGDFSTSIYKMNDVDWDIPEIASALSLVLCSDENCTETQPVTGESRAIYGGIGGQEEGTEALVDFFPATPLFGGRSYKLTISESAKIVSGTTEVSLRELVGLSTVQFSTAEMTRFVLPINLKYDNSNCLGGNVGQFAENTGQPMCRNIEQVAELIYGTAPHQLTHYFDTMSTDKTFALSPVKDKQGFVRPAIEIDRGKDYEPLGYCFRVAEIDGRIPFASCPNELGDGPSVQQQMAEIFDFDRYRIKHEDGTPNVLAPYRPDRESTIEWWANDANRDGFVHRNVTVIHNYGTFQSSALGSASSPSKDTDPEFTISNEERPRTWVHEMGHALFGLPDLYYHGGVGAATYNVGPVDIMGNNNGGMPPLTAWSLITSELAEPQSLISDLEMSNFINSDGYQLPAQEWSSTAAPAIPAIDSIPAVSYSSEPAFVEMQKHGVNGVSGLAGAQGVAVSPDGSHVYVASEYVNSIGVFSRDSSTGALTYVEAQQDGVGGVDGLAGAKGVTVSPDGSHVYVASSRDNAIAVFSRDSSTGTLTFVEMYQDGVDGVDGIRNVSSVTVSPNSSHVYAVSRDNYSIAVFSPHTTEQPTSVIIRRAVPAVAEEPASTAYAGCGTTNGKCTIYDNTQPEFKILKVPAIIERDTGEVKGHYLIEFYGTTGYSSEITLAPDTVDFSDQPGAFPGGIAIWKIDNTEQKVKTDLCRTFFGHSAPTLARCDLEFIKQNGSLTHRPEFYPLFPTISGGGGQTTISSFHLFPWWYSPGLPFEQDFEQDLSDMPYSIELPVLEIPPYGTSETQTTEFGGGSKVAIVTLSFESLVDELKSRIRSAYDSGQGPLSEFETYETNGSAEFTIQVRKLESSVPMTYADHIRPGQMEFVTGDLADEVLKYGYHIQHR